MLVLSRKRNESLFIGYDVRITVVDVRGDKVRLGIDASENIPVHREEVLAAILRDGGIDRSICPCCGCIKRQEVGGDEV